jgi:MFS family permease
VRAPAAYVRSLDPRLPRAVWLLQSGGLASAFGNGLAFPYLLIYLHNVRGISLGVAGLVLGASAATGLVTGPLAGTLVDRVGGKRVLAAALVLLALGFGGLPFVTEVWHAFALMLVAGAGNGGFWPAQSALVTGLTPRDRRHAAFGMQRVMNNLGIGLGAMVGGFVATTENVTTFTVLFLADGATFLVFVGVLATIRAPRRAREPGELPGRYRDVLRDRVFVAVLALNALFVTVGYGFVEVVPVFAKNEAAVSETAIGFVFFVNTMTIVLVQLVVVKAAEGRRRMPAFALMGALWAVTWLLVLAGGLWFAAAGTVALLAVALAVFGLGECLHGAVQGALVADLAPARLLGRYMALSAVSWQVGLAAGPAIGGLVLERSATALWLAAAGVCVAAAAASLVLERRLPREARRTPARAHPAPAPQSA